MCFFLYFCRKTELKQLNKTKTKTKPQELLAKEGGVFSKLVENSGKKNAVYLRSLAAAAAAGRALDAAALVSLELAGSSRKRPAAICLMLCWGHQLSHDHTISLRGAGRTLKPHPYEKLKNPKNPETLNRPGSAGEGSGRG